MDFKRLSKRSTDSPSGYQNISLLETDSILNQSGVYEFSPSLKKNHNFQDDLKISHEPSNFSNLNYHPQDKMIQELYDDVKLLKDTVHHIITQINKKDKRKYKKKVILKEIESKCMKNDTKVDKFENSLKNHEERIIGLERIITRIETTNVSDKKLSPKSEVTYVDCLAPRCSPNCKKIVNLTLSGQRGAINLYSSKQKRNKS